SQNVVVSGSNINMQLGTPGSPIVNVTNGSGLFIITGAGFAGKASATVSATAGTGVTLGGTYSLQINTIPDAIAQNVTFGATTNALTLPTGPYLRISGTGATLTVAGQTLTGNFTFEQ